MRKLITIIYYTFVAFLIGRVVISWIPSLQTNIVGKIIYGATDPVFVPLQKIIPSVGGLDFTVIIVWFALSYLYRWLMGRVF